MKENNYIVTKVSYVDSNDTRMTEKFEDGLRCSNIEELRESLKQKTGCTRVLLVYEEIS